MSQADPSPPPDDARTPSIRVLAAAFVVAPVAVVSTVLVLLIWGRAGGRPSRWRRR